MEKILKLQLALFFQNLIVRPDTLMGDINSAMGNLFDGMPQTIPLPADAPAEIPRVYMRSEDGKYNCNISCSRIDFILNGNLRDEVTWLELNRDFLAKIKLFSSKVFEEIKIVRFGLIGNFFVPDKLPAAAMTKRYLKVDLNSAEEINLRFNKRSLSFGLQLNNITSINTATMDTGDSQSKGIFVELDINNVPTGDTIKLEHLLQLVSNHMAAFSPDKVKELVK